MEAARANDSLRTQAGGLLADAEQTLAQANQAEEPTVRHHFIYMTEKNLDIAEAIAARQQAEEELATLSQRQDEVRAAPVPVPAPPPTAAIPEPLPAQPAQPALSEAEANLVREIQRERREEGVTSEAPGASARGEGAGSTAERREPRKPFEPLVAAVPVIHFAAGATELSPGAKRRLDPLVVQLRENETIYALVEGYTDASGEHEWNLQVSLARARAVKSYLVEQGISGERVQTLGLGAQYPVASNRTEEGRRQNRRVEIVLDRVEGNSGPVTGRR